MDRQVRRPPVVCPAVVGLVRELQPHLDARGVAVVLNPFASARLLAEIAQPGDDPSAEA